MKKVVNTLAVIGVIASIMLAGGAMDSDKMFVAFVFVGVAGVMVLVANRTQDDN